VRQLLPAGDTVGNLISPARSAGPIAVAGEGTSVTKERVSAYASGVSAVAADRYVVTLTAGGSIRFGGRTAHDAT
jgi:hypothetical protein